MELYDGDIEPVCGSCGSLVVEPYIQCVECPSIDHTARPTICLHCFAKGVQFDNHRSDHSYSIVKNNFPVFERAWTALEEIHLLKAVSECGYGNCFKVNFGRQYIYTLLTFDQEIAKSDQEIIIRADISHRVRTKNPSDCEHHYNSCYVNSPEEMLPKFPDADLDFHPSPVVFKLCEDPPRSAEGSVVTQEMAGYMAGRGDFMTEYMNYMELDLRGLEFDCRDEPLEEELKVVVVHAYQRCLQERWRRKRLIRRHGLINMRKNAKIQMRYMKSLGHNVERLKVFTQILRPESHDMYLESMHYEQELRSEIRHLQEYRSSGLKKLRHIQLYQMLKKKREEEQRERHLLSDVIAHMKDEAACQTWLQRQAALETLGKGSHSTLPTAPRRPAPPLEIAELPGFDKLSAKERDLCSHIRLVPTAYLEFKSLLQAECQKLGSLKLAQARLLIKIDVNKTRKIYDFLVAEEVIVKDC